MAHEEFESIINVLKCIGVRGRRVEGGPDVGCYDVATTPIVTAAELQCVSSLHDDSSDRIWTSLEEYGTTFSELAKYARNDCVISRATLPLEPHQGTACLAVQ